MTRLSQSAPKNVLQIFLVQLLFIAIYNAAVDSHMVGRNPHRRVEILDSQGNYILEWEVDWSAKKITFNVTVATKGYVGFGLSDKGKMSGADIVIGGVLPNGRSYFSDRHAVANQLPEVDRSQDYDLHEASENGTHTFLSFSRQFDTCDPQDYPIVEDKVSLIWAYGERVDGLEYHYRNRGEYQVHLLDPYYTPEITRDPETNYPLVIGNPYNEDIKVLSWNISMVMPSTDTTYWCTMHKGPILPTKHHMIGFETRFTDPVSSRHVHHIQISRCHAPQGFNAHSMFDHHLGQGQVCYNAGGRSQTVQSFTGPIPIEYCSDLLTGSAVGDRIWFLPPHLGAVIGETPDEYYMIQVHYDNPERLTGIKTDVSLDVYYTPHLREHDADMLVVRHESPGQPISHLIPPSSIGYKNHGICGSECTQKMFPKEFA